MWLQVVFTAEHSLAPPGSALPVTWNGFTSHLGSFIKTCEDAFTTGRATLRQESAMVLEPSGLSPWSFFQKSGTREAVEHHNQLLWVQIPAFQAYSHRLLTSYVTLGKSLHLSDLNLLICKLGIIIELA